MAKTNAMRLLGAAGITYTVKEYPVDESDLSAVHAAESMGMPPEQVLRPLYCKALPAPTQFAAFPPPASWI
jgi:Cys-tRNA(Pro)/Cys-tRNA(Cys) deacylase